jgi:lysine decarboxylase
VVGEGKHVQPADDAELVADAPLLESWLAAGERVTHPFTIPGHKGAAGRLSAPLGALLAGDVPLHGGLDTVKLSVGRLADAQARAARLWRADWCRFSTGGSTHANQALALAIGRPGDEVLVTRAAHRSTVLGIVLAGLTPVWLPVAVDDRFGVPLGVTESSLRSAIGAHPAARAVLLVEPSYLGTVSDLPALVALAHEAGLAVLVDQAWGAHLGFHPDLPPHALDAGADAFVASAHKTLPAYSQASLVLARTVRLDADRLERAFEAANTTSPAGAILASIDGARALLATRGPALLAHLLELVDGARQRLRAIAGVRVPGPEDFPPGRFDATKLVVILGGTGASGIDVERHLIGNGIPVELADQDTVVPIVTMADTETGVTRLTDALREAIAIHRGPSRPARTAVQWGPPPPVGLTPRDAFFAAHTTVAASEAVGRISAETIAPYPPGVPVLVPGEVVTAGLLDALQAARATGVRVAYASDPTLSTLQVVADESA